MLKNHQEGIRAGGTVSTGPRGRILLAATTVGLVLLGPAGCATRGYVRHQMADLRTDMGQMNTGLQAGIQEAKGAASSADAKAVEAASGLQSARDLALGHVGYQEAGRFHIYFPYNSAEPEASSQAELGKAATEIIGNPNYLVELLGFTDPKGSTAYNYELGRRRAEAVLRALAEKTPAQLSRYQLASYGETPPSTEAAGLGDGPSRRQVAIILVERTAQTKTEAVSQK